MDVFAIYDNKNKIILSSIRENEQDCKDAFLVLHYNSHIKHDWQSIEQLGYTCKPIEIKE
jgi:hypothetical protein